MIRRDGAIVTLFLIFFFALLVALGLILLTAQRASSEKEDLQVPLSYDDAQAMVVLVGLLRQPFQTGGEDQETIADAIARNDPAMDERIRAVIESRLTSCAEPDLPCSLTVTWPGGRSIAIDRFGALEDLIIPVTVRLPSAAGAVLVELRLGSPASLTYAASTISRLPGETLGDWRIRAAAGQQPTYRGVP